MKMGVAVAVFVLCAFTAHGVEPRKGCRDNPQTAIQEISKYLPSGVKPSAGIAFRPTYDLTDMQKNLPKEGIVSSETIAIELGETILSSVYGRKLIESERPFKANLIEGGIWIVTRGISDEMADKCIFPTLWHYVAIRKNDATVLGIKEER